eukprot:s1706_g12.t1
MTNNCLGQGQTSKNGSCAAISRHLWVHAHTMDLPLFCTLQFGMRSFAYFSGDCSVRNTRAKAVLALEKSSAPHTSFRVSGLLETFCPDYLQCQPWINKPHGCFMGGYHLNIRIMTVGRCPPN